LSTQTSCPLWLPLSIIAAVLTPWCSYAQTASFEGKPIVDIQYTPGPGLNAADLARAQPLEKGSPLRMDDVSKAIDGLYATGRFRDIAVEAEASGNGVVVTFVTQPKWFVGGVNITG